MNKAIQKYKSLPVQVRAAFWFLVCSFLQKGISMITTPIFTRLMTTEEYGRYNVFNSWYSIISVFVTLSLSSGVFSQGIVKFEEDRDRFTSSLQGITAIMCVLWIVVYLLFSSFWNQLFSLNTIQMLSLLIMCWTSSAFLFWAVEQRTLNKYQNLVALTFVVSLAKPILGIILVSSAVDKATARIIGLVAVEAVAAIYCFIIHIRKSKVLVDINYWKYAIGFNLPLIPHYLSQTVLNNSDRIMIERMVGVDKAGIYGIAYSISLIMIFFHNALSQTISPWMFKKIKDRHYQDIAPVAYGTLAFIGIMNIFLIAAAPEVVRIFAPPEYYEAIWVVPPVAMSCFFLFMYDYFARFEFYYEKTKKIMLASIFGAILNLVLNYIFIQIWGYIAAAYTTLVCYIVYVFCHYFFMMSICKEKDIHPKIYDNRILLGMSVAFLTISFAIMATYKTDWIRYTIIIVAMVIVVLNYKRIMDVIKKFRNLRNSD